MVTTIIRNMYKLYEKLSCLLQRDLDNFFPYIFYFILYKLCLYYKKSRIDITIAYFWLYLLAYTSYYEPNPSGFFKSHSSFSISTASLFFVCSTASCWISIMSVNFSNSGIADSYNCKINIPQELFLLHCFPWSYGGFLLSVITYIMSQVWSSRSSDSCFHVSPSNHFWLRLFVLPNMAKNIPQSFFFLTDCSF